LFPWSRGSAQEGVTTASFGVVLTLRELRRALSTRTTAMLVCVAGTYCVAEGLYDPLTVEFFVQHLGWGAEDYARAQGTLGVMGELGGALLGGYLCDRYGRRRIARIGLLLMGAILLTFGATSGLWQSGGYPHVLLLPAFKGTLAFTTVSLLSLYMKVSWTRVAATQFTLYMAMANLGYASGAKLNTWLERAGLELTMADFYLVAGLLALLPLVFLGGLDPDGIEARKHAERAGPALARAD
jgi:PAT family beta-lactamase induction signal transducer AmpG